MKKIVISILLVALTSTTCFAEEIYSIKTLHKM